MRRDDLKIKIFADGAEKKSISELVSLSHIKGFTTNPSLMRNAGVSDYRKHLKDLIETVQGLPISLEVIADDMNGVYKQAKEIADMGENVFAKIPIVNSKGNSMAEVISILGKEGIPLNITAIMTSKQVENLIPFLTREAKIIFSIFAGRIADTGRNPCPVVKSSVEMVKKFKNAEVLWASTREVYNVVQAEEVGCHIITIPYALIKKMDLFGKDLADYSRETAEAFYLDAVKSGFKI